MTSTPPEEPEPELFLEEPEPCQTNPINFFWEPELFFFFSASSVYSHCKTAPALLRAAHKHFFLPMRLVRLLSSSVGAADGAGAEAALNSSL